MAYDSKEQNRLAIQWQDKRDQDSATELYSDCIGILKTFAQKLAFIGESEDDIVADFHIQFVRALDTWERQRGIAFSSHFYNLVHNAFVSRIAKCNAAKRKNRDGYRASTVSISLDAPVDDENGVTLAEAIADPNSTPVESFAGISLIASTVSSDPGDQQLLTAVATGEIELYDLPVECRARVLSALPSAKRKLQREYERDYPARNKKNTKPQKLGRQGVWQVTTKCWAAKYSTKYLGTFPTEEAALAAREQAQLERAQREAASKQLERPDEEWRVIAQKPLYEVSSLGRVRNAKTLHILKPWRASSTKYNGAMQVELRDQSGDNNHHRFQVTRLVAGAFISGFDNADETITIRHKNHDPTDNRVENLSLCKQQPPKPRMNCNRGMGGIYQNTGTSWSARLGRLYLGSYPTEQAARAALESVRGAPAKIVENT